MNRFVKLFFTKTKANKPTTTITTATNKKRKKLKKREAILTDHRLTVVVFPINLHMFSIVQLKLAFVLTVVFVGP